MPKRPHAAENLPPRLIDVHVSWARLRPEQFTHPPCPLCGTFAFTPKASLVINWSEFFIVQCTSCKLMWRTPMPDLAFLQDLYAEAYFDTRAYPENLADQVGIADATAQDKAARRLKTEDEVRRWQRRDIGPLDALGRQRKLLEIGGGRGYLQRAARDIGWDTLGLEISPHGIREAIARNLSMIPAVLDDLCERYLPYPKYFDAVVFFDFLEHVTDPGRVLRMVRAILRDDGVIILRVPCIEETDVPRFHLVDHIFHFSDRTLRLMLEREGFAIEEAHDSGRFPGTDGQVRNVTCYARKTSP